MRYAHTNIIAKDWKSLADFYTQVFKCTFQPPQRNQSGEFLAKGTGVEGAALEGVHLVLPGYGENGPTLEIYSYNKMLDNPNNLPHQYGFRHIAFEVGDVNEVVEQVVKYGGTLLGEVVEKHIAGVGLLTFVYAKDPEGNILEIQSWKKD